MKLYPKSIYLLLHRFEIKNIINPLQAGDEVAESNGSVVAVDAFQDALFGRRRVMCLSELEPDLLHACTPLKLYCMFELG